MTDAALVAKKLAQVETCLSDLRRLARPDALETDIRERRFVEHTDPYSPRTSTTSRHSP